MGWRIPRAMTMVGIISTFEEDEDEFGSSSVFLFHVTAALLLPISYLSVLPVGLMVQVQIVKCEEYSGSSDLNFEDHASSSCSHLKLNLIGMGFLPYLVDKAIHEHGENNVDLLLETLFTLSDDASAFDGSNGLTNDESLCSVQELEGTTTIEASFDSLTHQLHEMGFSEEEISMAIDCFGPETPISELADSIFAKRISYDDKDAFSCKIQCNSGKKTEPICTSRTAEQQRNVSVTSVACDAKRSSLDADLCQTELLKKAKKGKSISVKPRESASYLKENKELKFCNSSQVPMDLPNRYVASPDLLAKSALPSVKTLPIKKPMDTNKCRKYPSEPPYLLYGNVIDVPDEAWEKLSRFLYGMDIEYVDAELFSALTRKEGFIHNLPLENRVRIHPGSPTTIQDVLPFTRKSWPSWDTRTKLNCIPANSIDIRQSCEGLGKILVHARGILSQEEQADILHRCRELSLSWAGEHSLVPLAPHNAEVILGYPEEHTRLSGLEDAARLMLLKQSFQTDLLGYLFSPLMLLYPNGLTVLSVFSGIGGAEIALSKLGIHLKCVVSIEPSENNRKILRRWWDSTGQSGCLRQISSIRELSGQQIQHMVEEVGGFDLVVAGNLYTDNEIRVGTTAGVNFTLYFEFVRLYQMVRGVMTRRK